MKYCEGNGECLMQDDDENKYSKNPNIICDKNCTPIKCPNYILCGAKYPKILLDCHDNLCLNCDMMFGRWKGGKGILDIFSENKECPKCKNTLKCLSLPKCEHYLCINCFKKYNYDKKCIICTSNNIISGNIVKIIFEKLDSKNKCIFCIISIFSYEDHEYYKIKGNSNIRPEINDHVIINNYTIEDTIYGETFIVPNIKIELPTDIDYIKNRLNKYKIKEEYIINYGWKLLYDHINISNEEKDKVDEYKKYKYPFSFNPYFNDVKDFFISIDINWNNNIITSIIDKFNDQTIEILKTSPIDLLEIENIGYKKISELIDKLELSDYQKNVFSIYLELYVEYKEDGNMCLLITDFNNDKIDIINKNDLFYICNDFVYLTKFYEQEIF